MKNLPYFLNIVFIENFLEHLITNFLNIEFIENYLEHLIYKALVDNSKCILIIIYFFSKISLLLDLKCAMLFHPLTYHNLYHQYTITLSRENGFLRNVQL